MISILCDKEQTITMLELILDLNPNNNITFKNQNLFLKTNTTVHTFLQESNQVIKI